jgi:hypothetical protein
MNRWEMQARGLKQYMVQTGWREAVDKWTFVEVEKWFWQKGQVFGEYMQQSQCERRG